MFRSRFALSIFFLIIVVVVTVPLSPLSHARSDVRYFSETGYTLRGAFHSFWETNGGLTIFGYPITNEYTSSETGRTTQFFERARFELVQQNGEYAVALGELGLEYTEYQLFPKVPPISNSSTKRYIPQNQHIIKYGFKEIWERYGEDRIFGYPISEEMQEKLDNGEWHTVQYFERARFEYWPSLPPGERVLITHLGRKLLSTTNPTMEGTTVIPDATPVSASTPTAIPVVPTATSIPLVPTPTTVPLSPSATTTPSRSNCDPSYPTVCIPPPPPDLDCSDIPYTNFRVLPPDPHRLDRDKDGIGCES